MDAKVHRYIVERAIEFLPEKVRDYWSREFETMRAASEYPDIYNNPNSVSPKLAVMEPDWYELLHVKSEDKEYLLHTALDPSRLTETYPKLTSAYISKIMIAFKQNNTKKVAKLMGCLSHYIGDTGQPAHVVSDREIAELFPYVQNGYMVYHEAVESILGRAENEYQSQLLGLTLVEINWAVIQKLEHLKSVSRAQEILILNAIYYGEFEKAQEPANKAVQACVELFSDILYSFYCIHNSFFDENERNRLSKLDLSELIPVNSFCDMMYGFKPLIGVHPDFSKKKGLTYKLVSFDLGIGEQVNGIALLPNMAPGYKKSRNAFAEYNIPAGTYKSLTAIVGLNHKCENGTECIFEIWLDDNLAYRSKALGDKTTGEQIKLPLKDSSKIVLLSKDARNPPCQTEFFYPIWGNVTLHR